MSAELFFQILINGLSVGMTYVLVAAGFTLVLGVARIINFAHVDFYMLGGLAIYYIYGQLHINYFLALIIAAPLVALLGVLCERFYFRYKRGHFLQAVAGAVGIGLIITGSVAVTFGTNEMSVPTVFPGIARVGAIAISWERIAVIILSLAIMLGLYYLIMRTKAGKAMRAVVLDPDVAAMQGVNVNRTFMIAMAVGTGLAAIAGALIAPVFSVTPYMGGSMLFKALLVMFIGGIGSVWGAVLGGLILGLIDSFGFAVIGGWVTLAGFVIVLMFALFKPGGLLGVPWEV